MKIEEVFLDMDGVLTNFHKGVCDSFDQLYDLSNLSMWDFWKDWKPKTTRTNIIDICDQDFWAELEWHDEGHEILHALEDIYGAENIFLVTKPMPNPGSWTGKKMWVDEHLFRYGDRLIITEASRAMLASPTSLLVDDSQKNVDDFRMAGGQAILIPRPWNSLNRHKVIQHLEVELDMIRRKGREIKMLEGKTLHGHPQFYDLLQKMAELHSRKNHDYAGSENPLRNFYKCKEMGISPFKGIMVRLSDKWSRLESFLKQGVLEVKDESIKDTLMDSAVYSLLAMILFDEQLKENQACPENVNQE